MVALNSRFLLGKYREAFLVNGKGENPVKAVFTLMLKFGLIDGLLTASEDGNSPRLILKSEDVEIPVRNSCFGVNALLKKAVQKYRLSKLAVFGPACTFDGLNKTQYFGIGCNWTKTAVALKVSFLCPGVLTDTAFLSEVVDIAGKRAEVSRFYFQNGELHYRLKNGEEIAVPPALHHRYVNSACRYCLNMAGKGTDLTAVYLKEINRALFIVRSERGLSTLAQIQRNSPSSLQFRKAGKGVVDELLSFLREKVLLNISDIIERVELGLPVPKWNDNKLRKFYRIWNSVDVNSEEEVF